MSSNAWWDQGSRMPLEDCSRKPAMQPLWERPKVSRNDHREGTVTPSAHLRLTVSETSWILDFPVLWANKCFLLLRWMWVTFCHVQPRKSWTVQGLSSLRVFRAPNMIPQSMGPWCAEPFELKTGKASKARFVWPSAPLSPVPSYPPLGWIIETRASLLVDRSQKPELLSVAGHKL